MRMPVFLAHGAVEAVHDVGYAGFVGAVDLGEVLSLGGPGGVGDEGDVEALLLGLGEVEAEFALGGDHAGDGRELAGLLEFQEGLAVRFGGEVVEDLDSLCGLLQGEVAHVGDEYNEFLLVVGAAQGLGGGFDDDDACLGGGLLGERAGAVGVAVVGDVDPAGGI